ncbi:MAG: hypothetical protein LUG18_03085 [Candidatus Azobacteroides sp.]|nr:hypothetical protein [Candidatus Azobacteroides sp.]
MTATHTQVSTTDYYGNKIYREGNIAMVLTPEGYLAKQNGSWQYNYYLRDHLGNIRVVQDASGNILESTDYYPFGMPFAELKENSVQPYKFGGKELESMHGLNVQDFEARWKDVSIPIFTTPDPLAGKRPWESPYMFCGNNPLRFIDPTGLDYWSTSDPEEIRKFYNQLTSQKKSKFDDQLAGFNFTSWHHATDDEFLGRLTFNDESNNFIYSYISIKNDEWITTAQIIPGLTIQNDGRKPFAFIRNDDIPVSLQSGSLTNVYPEFDILLGLRLLFSAATIAISQQVGQRGTTVLGHYPEYTKLASELGAKRFNIPTNIWNKMSPSEQWAANLKFLDRMILRGDNIRLATPLKQVKPGSFYQKELNYLFEKGYHISSDGLWLIK